MREEASRPQQYELECVPGLEACARRELQACGALVQEIMRLRPGFLRFRFAGDPTVLFSLRSAIAIYAAHRFEIPRPKAFLGHQHFRRLTSILRAAMRGWNLRHARLGIGAAGAQSPVMQRLQAELARAFDIDLAAPAGEMNDPQNKGELFLRLARSPDRMAWEALLRLGPRPLSKRAWRKINVPGALNATVAYAMTQIARRDKSERVLNLCCGSGTILVEHALGKTKDRLFGVDNSAKMLHIAKRHFLASGTAWQISLLQADAGCLALPSRSFDRIYADLPFGGHIGSHADNLRLYPNLLAEAARIAKPDATLILLTHELKLLRECIARSNWRQACKMPEIKITLSGLHPRIFVLEQKSTRI